MKKPLTQEEIKFILEKKDTLYSAQIAQQINRSQSTIRRYFARNNIEHKTRKLYFNSLTPQEDKVLKLLANGYSNLEIQEKLFLASSTVATHVLHIYQKLNLSVPDKKENGATRVKAALKYHRIL